MKMKPTNTTTATQQARRKRQATSLVEVLVVLVILLIGVFAVIRVFPLGFQFLQASESKTKSIRLAHNEMERLKNDAANLPDAIRYAHYDANGVHFIADEDSDNLIGAAGNPYFQDVNKFRYVQNEPVKIGLPTPGVFGSGFVYMMKFGPVYLDATVGNPDNAPTTLDALKYYSYFLNVKSAPLGPARQGDRRADPNLFRTM
jgi:type II secretory pathway pseudopilin PulG